LLVLCLETGLVLAVCCSKGTKHDFQMYKDFVRKGTLVIHKNIKILADSGVQGLHKMHPKTELPFKKSKKKPLTTEQKEYNRQVAQKRVPIEHKNRPFKIFRIVKETYRGKHKNYGLNWNLVPGLVNFRRATTHCKNA
jgi:IS5 family transposase